MDCLKEKTVRLLVDTGIKSFMLGLKAVYEAEKTFPGGAVNTAKNKCFVAELGDEMTFYSAIAESFETSLGNTLKSLGNNILSLSYEEKENIHSFILPEQTRIITSVLESYENCTSEPSVQHYEAAFPDSLKNTAACDYETVCCFFNNEGNEYYLVEFDAFGDLNKDKALMKKRTLLKEYFLLRNSVKNSETAKIKIFLGTACNRCGEDEKWQQASARQFFADEELLIGKDYWNFVCNDEHGFEIVFDQYKKSAVYMKDVLKTIKSMYFNKDV